MFTLTDSKTVPLTRALAKEFCDMPASATERVLDPSRVKHLAGKAAAGHLVSFNWSTVTCDGVEYRMNGQHSSNMLCDLNGEFPDGATVHLDRYEVDSKDGQALLFRQFDDRKSGRSPNDVSGAYQGLYEGVLHVPRMAAKLAVEGVAWFMRVVEGSPAPTGDDRYSLFAVEALHEFTNFVGEIIGVKQPEMKRDTLIAAIYATFIANEAEARLFWTNVSKGGVDYEPEHPATVLSLWLQSAKDKESKLKPKAAHFFQAAIYAWNAFRKGQDFKSIPDMNKAKDFYEPAE